MSFILGLAFTFAAQAGCDHHFSFLGPSSLYGLEFIQSKYSQATFKRLKPFKDEAFLKEIQWPWMEQEQLDLLSTKFQFKTQKGNIITAYFELAHDPEITKKILVSGKKQKVSRPHVTVIATLFMNKDIVGFTARNIRHDQFGNLVADTYGMYVNQGLSEIKNISEYIMQFWYEEVYVKIPNLRTN